jgi:tripeptide aminopeptidase
LLWGWRYGPYRALFTQQRDPDGALRQRGEQARDDPFRIAARFALDEARERVDRAVVGDRAHDRARDARLRADLRDGGALHLDREGVGQALAQLGDGRRLEEAVAADDEAAMHAGAGVAHELLCRPERERAQRLVTRDPLDAEARDAVARKQRARVEVVVKRGRGDDDVPEREGGGDGARDADQQHAVHVVALDQERRRRRDRRLPDPRDDGDRLDRLGLAAVKQASRDALGAVRVEVGEHRVELLGHRGEDPYAHRHARYLAERRLELMPAAFTSALAQQLAPDVLERLIRYARIETTSMAPRTASPSTAGQLDLARLLRDELAALGLDDVSLDENGYVTAHLPGKGEATIGLIAHVDTSPDAPGAGVEPIVHRDYDGGVIALPRAGTVLDPATMPELRERAGHDLVTASGDTLLGADDKAGCAEIMAAVAHLVAHPELPRPTLAIGFTPDEEIGHGATFFPLERFGARFAYTLDGSEPGELQDETFSAAAVTLTVTAPAVHPGLAKGRMANALALAARIVAGLPHDRLTPDTTDGREGFIHVHKLAGSPERASVVAIVRDFDDELLASHIDLLVGVAERVVGGEPRAALALDVVRQYPNMRRFIEPYPQIVEHAERAIREEGLDAVRTAIRGGTDGSRLSEMGLPTPNIFTGGHEFHSPREWASVQEMAAAAAVIVRLAGIWAAGA